jgi:hypothetical protein
LSTSSFVIGLHSTTLCRYQKFDDEDEGEDSFSIEVNIFMKKKGLEMFF